MQAQSREYQGPINTEQVMLIRCAVGHIPSIRRIGEITTPMATIIARNTIRKDFHGDLTVQNRGEGVEFLITLPKYGG